MTWFVFFDASQCYIGMRWDALSRTLTVCLLPMVGIEVVFR